MAGITREQYMQYAKKIVSVLSGEQFYNQYRERVKNGANSFKLQRKKLIQEISVDWIDTIEGILPNLDHIVRNPRKFIVQEEDIVDVSLARSISTESVKHLAQHTNMISKVEEDGTVIPSKILNITKEESFEIYENRFIYTLLLKVKDFVTMRYDKIKKASATQDVLELDAESKFSLPKKKVTYRSQYMAQLGFDEVMRLDPETMEKIERIARMDRIITDFLSSPFAKQMRNSAPVRPPITRTNVILKEPNFKKALVLWQFIETYNVTAGFNASDDITDLDLSTESVEQLKDMVTLNTMLFESMYDEHETDFDMEDAAFADFIKLGEMDFKADNVQHDEYSQKADEDELKNEAEKEEEVKEEPTEAEKPPEEKEKEQEEVEKEVEKEKEVDRDLETPAPPKDLPDMDEEPDAEKFDQNLFDVRKLYKRPEEDRLRQTEINRIKDAIDRCLISYRAIKQEELEKERQEELRRKRQEDLDRRANALKEQRDREASLFGMPSLRDKYNQDQAAKTLFGTGSFAENHPELFFDKNEKLDLEDKDLDRIRREIDEMERAKRLILLGRLNMTTGEVEGINEFEVPEVEETPVQEAPVNVVADKEEEPVQEEIKEEVLKTEEELAIEKAKKVAEEIEKPTSKPKRAMRNFKPVDESKVGVGNSPVDYGLKGDLSGSAYGFAMTGFKRITPVIPVAKEEEKQEPIQVPTLTPSPEDFNPWAERPGAKKPEKSVPSVKTIKTFKPVDITKSQVGDAPIKYNMGFAGLDDTGLGFTLHTDTNAPRYRGLGDNEEEDNYEDNIPLMGTIQPKVEQPKPQVKKDPWAITTQRGRKAQQASMIAKQTHVYKPIDENKVKVGDSPVDRLSTRDLLGTTFGAQRANLGKLGYNEPVQDPFGQSVVIKPEKPKKERKKKEEKPVEQVQPAVVPVVVTHEEKPTTKRDPNALSPTTINQKYSKKSGKQKTFKPIDETKVSVGDLPVGFGSIQNALGNFGIENQDEDEDE